jgi:hypothetical protein
MRRVTARAIYSAARVIGSAPTNSLCPDLARARAALDRAEQLHREIRNAEPKREDIALRRLERFTLYVSGGRGPSEAKKQESG